MALTDEQESALRAELASLSGELATIARVNGLIQRAHARHEAEERQEDDDLTALRARLTEAEGREQTLRALVRDYWQKLHRQTCLIFCCKGWDRECAHPRPPALAAAQPATAEPAAPRRGRGGAA